MSSRRFLVLGAGMAGFGAAYQLSQEGIRPTMYDERPAIGGHTSTRVFEDGFVFDEGPHVSFTKDKRIQELESQIEALRLIDQDREMQRKPVRPPTTVEPLQ